MHKVPRPRLVLTEAELDEAVDELSSWPSLVVDVETDGLNTISNRVLWVGLGSPERVWLIPLGHPKGRLLAPPRKGRVLPPEEERKVLKDGTLSMARKSIMVPAVYDETPKQLRPDIVFDRLKGLIFDPNRTKIGHNVKFDMRSIAKYYGEIPPGPYHDTLVLAHVLDENLINYGLKELVMDWFRVPPKRRAAFYPKLGKDVQSSGIDEIALYLQKDVWYCQLFYRKHMSILARHQDLQQVFDFEMQVYEPLMNMEHQGVRIDLSVLEQRGQELSTEIREIEHRVWDICGEQFPLTQTAKLRAFFFGPKRQGGQGLKPLSYTQKTNTPQLNQACLEHYAPTNELAALLLDWSAKTKVYGTFIKGLEEKLVAGRLHTTYKQHGTVTARLSSSEPNLQQIPRVGVDEV